MKKLIFILILSWVYSDTKAEGTAQLRPSSSDFGNVQVNDVNRPFALESNTDSLHRLYIHIKNTTEKIYFGFQPKDKTAGHGTFRIKNSAGTVVYNRTNVPVSAGAGYINSYDEAVAGPKIGGLPTGGYNPLSLTPTTTGDYYIEFTTTRSDAYHFDLFDITVVNASNQPIKGRVWSYAWDLNTQGQNNVFNGTMYVYTGDRYITSVYFNGIRPYGFVVSCNSKGTQNTGNEFNDRKSVSGNHTYPEYKVFLNIPDTSVYVPATIPTMIEDLKVIGSPITGSSVKFYLNMNKGGSTELFLDLDGIAGYQAGNLDVVLVKSIKAGGDTIVWDGKDAQGNYVAQAVTVGVTSRFATGVTHLPIYDAEFHPNGFIVNRITPNSSRASVYWDDTKFGGTVNFTGASGNNDGHNFPDTTDGYGNVRTINTWWNGYENDDLKSFSFTMDGTYTPLPVSLIYFSSLINGKDVVLEWETASESNNDYFEIQRSPNNSIWEICSKIKGAGTTTINTHYLYQDKHPLMGVSYYRLRQVDFNDVTDFSPSISVNINSRKANHSVIYPNPAINSITIESNINSIQFQIFSIDGTNQIQNLKIDTIDNNTIEIDIKKLVAGMYLLQINGDIHLFVKQ